MTKKELKNVIKSLVLETIKEDSDQYDNLGMDQTSGIVIDIHRETGLVTLQKKHSDDFIELVAEDIEALCRFYNANKDKIAKAADFN